MHDFSYQSVIYDLLETDTNTVTLPDGETHKLDTSDQIWMRFKNTHLAEVLTTLNEEVVAFATENAKVEGIGKEELDLSETLEVI